MNLDNIKTLRAHIAGLPEERFNMAQWSARQSGNVDYTVPEDLLTDCGTAGCIGGWACALAGTRETRKFNSTEIMDTARNYLGLTHEQAAALFLPDRLDGRTRAEAIAVLDTLIKTGQPHWEP
jgi:hypothetical protein